MSEGIGKHSRYHVRKLKTIERKNMSIFHGVLGSTGVAIYGAVWFFFSEKSLFYYPE